MNADGLDTAAFSVSVSNKLFHWDTGLVAMCPMVNMDPLWRSIIGTITGCIVNLAPSCGRISHRFIAVYHQ
jgi:hypothetical protein